MTPQDNFINILESIRKDMGYGVNAFSLEVLGIGTNYSSYLSGKRQISMNTMIKISNALGKQLVVTLGDKVVSTGEAIKRDPDYCYSCPITEYLYCEHRDPDHCNMRDTIKKFVKLLQEPKVDDNRGKGRV